MSLVTVERFRARNGRNPVPTLDRAAMKFDVADDGCKPCAIERAAKRREVRRESRDRA